MPESLTDIYGRLHALVWYVGMLIAFGLASVACVLVWRFLCGSSS
jgi:hypothetical protein